MKKIGWMGEFINPTIELAFRKKEWHQLRKRMVFSSFMGGSAYFLAIIADFMMILSEPMFKDMFFLRLSVLITGLIVGLSGVVFKEYTKKFNIAVCTLLLLVLVGESAELIIKAELMEYVGIPGVSIIVLLFYLSFPPRFVYVLSICVVGCVSFLITCYWLGYASVDFMCTSLLFFLVVNGFGAYVYLQFATIRRREYYALEKLKRNAEIDSLTQVYNRRKVLEVGDAGIESANKHNHRYSVIMIDVDNFKRVNDTYGHAIGDQVLREVASRCYNVLREIDVLGRFGGEEFVVFLPHTNIDAALIIGERLRSEVANTVFKTDKKTLSVTMSLGVATLSKYKETPSKLLEMADEALYVAKKTGKNKLCTAT